MARRETGEATFKRSQRDDSEANLLFFLDGHVSDQGQVKCKNGVFHFWEPGDAAFNSFDPNSAKVLPRVW